MHSNLEDFTSNVYTSPLKALYEELFTTFVHNNSVAYDRINNLSSQGKLRIKIDRCQSGLRTPQVNLQTKEIIIEETHLTFIWSFTYLVMTLFDIVVDTYNSDTGMADLSNHPEFTKLQPQIVWTASLRDGFSAWPIGLAKPTDKNPKLKSINNIFITATIFLLYHEINHLANHNQFLDLIKKANLPVSELQKEDRLSDDENLMLLQLEIESDNYAYECLIGNKSPSSEILKNIGAAIAQLSGLFFTKKGFNLHMKKQPNVHTRIFNLREKCKLSDPGLQACLDRIYSIAMTLFLDPHPNGGLYKKSIFHSSEELFDHLYNCLDNKNLGDI